MKAIVVGAGAWGLPAAAQLARRGHEVTLVDRYGPANALSSSPGPTRVWRYADPDPLLVRLGRRSRGAMDRLAAESGVETYRRVGLLWRDPEAVPALAAVLVEEGVDHELVLPTAVSERIPGLVPDERPAVWTPDAGCVLAAASLAAQLSLFRQAGGRQVMGRSVVELDPRDARVGLDDGSELSADVVVLAPGPGAVELLPLLGIDLELRPYAEQVVHFGDPERPAAYDDVPCLFDGPTDGQPGFYSMPTPGLGYKIGLNEHLRSVGPDDLDRTPDPDRTEQTRRRASGLGFLETRVLDAQVCVWTESPDHRFVVDRIDSVVLACGDSGAGFKFSALMGELLADLAEEATLPSDLAADVAALGLARDGLRASRPPRASGC